MADDDITTTRPFRKLSVTDEMSPTGDRALLIVFSVGQAGRTHVIGDEPLIIGRDEPADIRLAADDVSRRHARVQRQAPGVFVIEDLESRNGTRVNGVPAKGKQELRFGDKILIGGQHILLFTRYSEAEDRLLRSQRLASIGELSSGVAHDFNNILGILLANISFLHAIGDVSLAEREVQQCLEESQAAIMRGVQITRQLLAFVRDETFQERQLSVLKVVGEVANLIRRTLRRSIRVKIDVEHDLFISGDPVQLHQMLMNLCLNARDAMPDGGVLELRAEPAQVALEEADAPVTEAFVRLAVRDTGVGMSAEVCARAQEPFFTTKGKGEGTGLGLATASTIAERHGGRLEITSQTGVGTTVEVFLPAITDVAERPPRVEYSTSGSHRVITGCVLLVDDEPGVRAGVTRMLRTLGFEVLEAKDGASAVETYRENKDSIDVVLLDLLMPGMDGVAVFRAIRDINPEAKVLVTSGQLETATARKLLKGGAVDFLQKPFDANTLGKALARAIY
jgi:signal transduction histidine kinase/CheY-like chemotaxis protein